MKALIIGATGATGKDLVDALLQDPAWTEVVAFVRRSSGREHRGYTEVLTDFDKLGDVSESITGDVWFSCLGTTAKAAGTKEKQWHIDHDIPLEFARIARRNGIPRAVVLSAYGASSTSRVFYSRMKGSLDDAILQLGFPTCLIFRPGFLLRRDTDRPAERIIAVGLKFLNSLGLLRKFRPLPTQTLAGKMAEAAKARRAGTLVFALDEIFGI
ncbi:MAG: NAD-dependent epimerase/dehydratase family protein [Verrucomicrobiaceae bacterium]|nr:MAG: NAD-dependent epimerase/dehydratase family protein [Verrucomicrobiaceae bacterium]